MGTVVVDDGRTSNLQLLFLARGLKHFRGVFSLDTLPRKR